MVDWFSFLGALFGSVVGSLIILGGIVAWDEIEQRKKRKPDVPKPINLGDILESHLEQHIVQNFDTLFSGWSIYALNVNAGNADSGTRPIGVRYRTEAGEIDILCVDEEDNFVVIELKRNKAPDKVVAQTDRYIAWVQENMAQPNQKVRGLIIAKSVDKHLAYILSQRKNITFWAYSWHLQFDTHAVQTELMKTNSNVAAIA